MGTITCIGFVAMSGRQERTESSVSEADFSPLVEVRNLPEMEYSASGETSETLHLEKEKDESEDGDEVFNQEKEKTIESQEKRTERKRTTSGGRSIRFPCGVCGLGVGVGGVVCGACCLWIHNGKTKKCAGLEGKDEANSDTFRCPKCIESDQKVNAHLRKETLVQYNVMAKSSKKRTIQDSSPKNDEIGKNKKQKNKKLICILYQKDTHGYAMSVRRS